jgi:hypothetical protein
MDGTPLVALGRCRQDATSPNCNVRSWTGDLVRVTKPVAAVLTANLCHIAVGTI